MPGSGGSGPTPPGAAGDQSLCRGQAGRRPGGDTDPPGPGAVSIAGVSLKTTNCLESLNAQLGPLSDKVDHWRTSDQKQRWVASALSLIEPRLRQIKGYRHLPQLRAALQATIGKAKRVEGACIA
jgi:hypothetical protein